MDKILKKSEKKLVRDTEKEFNMLVRKDKVLDRMREKDHSIAMKAKRKKV